MKAALAADELLVAERFGPTVQRHAVARGATIRRELIQLAARPARTGRDQITWHLPQNWPWQDAWLGAFTATHHPPQAA